MLQWLKDLFSGWYRKVTIATRTELEQYIDRRMEELLEPEHWERATKNAAPQKGFDGDILLLLCGMRIRWVAPNAPLLTNRVYIEDGELSYPEFRSDIQQRFREALARTWPDKIPVYVLRPTVIRVDGIAKLEAARKAAGCPEHGNK